MDSMDNDEKFLDPEWYVQGVAFSMPLIWKFSLYLLICDSYRKSDNIIVENIRIEPMSPFWPFL